MLNADEQDPMTAGTDLAEEGPEELQVAFPATPTFTRIGRVAVVGLALRLGHDVATVERLRSAVDEAVEALQGSGRIDVRASWSATELTVTLANPDVDVAGPAELTTRLDALVGTAAVEANSVRITLDAPAG